MTPLERLKLKIETLVEEYNTVGETTCHRVYVEWMYSTSCEWSRPEEYDDVEPEWSSSWTSGC